MDQRTLGRTGRDVSVVGLGTWQLGGDWGRVEQGEGLAVLDAAYEAGVTFFDTADVYGDGRSEQTIGRWRQANPGAEVVVATKMIRRSAGHDLEAATAENFRAWTDRSRRNLGVDTLDLVQLHCPTSEVYGADRVFDDLDALVSDGAIAAYGVSVETVAEALRAIERPGVASVQIILNAFRRKPLDDALPAASAAGVGVIARVPLASGLLSGRYTRETTFSDDDHRVYNRHGEAFDVGETFSGVDYDTGVDAAQRFAALAREAGLEPAAAALAWVAQQPGVTTVIPGARNPEQARANAAAGSIAPLPQDFLEGVRDLYDEAIRPLVHDRW
ncbi:aldo/keto reductase [Microbacterium marinilacus]|uniref:Aldo/keto reductase n=1 Tax=Microbacterium marinilacus TaxID=415209 RepID=A0ABP7B403_9MICO|nr:aldo/keto reductase [Microbacterium marinilacus]MBY0687995.1 aldo/keto reductase [Microbacterium marinilacus]